MTFSIVIPAFNEAKTLERNIRKLLSQLGEDGLQAKIILVDDGSADDTWHVMEVIRRENVHVACIRLSRNFGKEAALFAGLSKVDTRRCLIMDSDMQHPPRLITEMMREMDESDADIIEGVKEHRGDSSFLYSIFARGFYKLLQTVCGMEIRDSSDFKLLNHKVIETMNSYRESQVFFRGLVEWSGFTKIKIPFRVEEREGDESKFSLRRLISLAFDSILSFTSKPLYLTLVLGILFLFIAVILGVISLTQYFTGRAVSGFTTVILLNLIIGSFTLISLGIIGAYISRIYTEIKRRPRYIISEYETGEGDAP